MTIKLNDVAKVAGVSPTTVSRVINNRGYISEKTKQKVENAMKELNYYPNDLARSLYKKRTNLVGLIIPDISNPFYSELALWIERTCSEMGYRVILCNSLSQPEKEEAYSIMLIRNQVDGIIVCSYNRGIETYKKSQLPIIAIDHYLSPSIPVVGSNNYEGGKMAVEHLINRGCKSIIHINGPQELETPTQLRREAYEDLVKNPVTYIVKRPLDEREISYTVRKVFQERPETDGIFASDDMIAAKCLQIAEELNIAVPNQLKIVGYDGTSTISRLLPQLTTIKQPIEDIAVTAVRHMMEMISNPEETNFNEDFLQPQIIINKTT
ncbi:LacI family transcriptional regulator [Gracilibacillus oryzae]|uniref:LacI family transcriptional regulator n=1 Tax=Gracilibacillus oryzae TaxID=1672701 RepID=A0A7C8L0R6_9BACI|nr:LacI family DNA-binding transcriptional regulator [Gracilibacillus oryzae]KAB8125920.1 LacI family transcriptional regulator [Gracilibacillus oryzae]